MKINIKHTCHICGRVYDCPKSGKCRKKKRRICPECLPNYLAVKDLEKKAKEN